MATFKFALKINACKFKRKLILKGVRLLQVSKSAEFGEH